MNVRIMSIRHARLLAVAGLLVAALTVTALAPARQVSADSPQQEETDAIMCPPYCIVLLPNLDVRYRSTEWYGGEPYLVFVVENPGPGTAGPFNVIVFDELQQGGSTIESFGVAGMEPGGSRTFYHKLPPDCSHNRSLRTTIRVDLGNHVPETNEGDNVTTYWWCKVPC